MTLDERCPRGRVLRCQDCGHLEWFVVGLLENKRPRHRGGAAASGALLMDAIIEPRPDALAKVGHTVSRCKRDQNALSVAAALATP